MDLTTLDFAAARDHMVDSQIRPNRIIDPRIIRAMRTLPRERFLPPQLASQAYIDEDLPLPGGRNFMEPLVLARLIQLARARTVLPAVAPEVRLVEGELPAGQPGPWDVILIEGAVREIPHNIAGELNG